MKNIIKNQSSIKLGTKIINLIFLMIALMLASCAIEEPEQITIVKPLTRVDKEFLQGYDALNTYVDRSANPSFRLGAGISMNDLTDKGLKYRLLASNFDQVSPVSGLFHASIMASDGSFDFSKIPAFLTTASEAGLSVFGPALVWHTEQRAAYFLDSKTGLLADDRTVEQIWVPDEGGGVPDYGEKLVNGDFKDDVWNTSFKQNGAAVGALTADGEGPGGKGRALMINNPAVQTDSWKCQMVVVWKDAILEGEEWTFKMDYKSDVNCNFGNQAQAGLGSYQYNNIVPAVDSKTTWQTLEHKIVYNKEKPGITAIAFDLGATATNYYFANVSLYKHPVMKIDEMLVNGDFEDDVWNTSFKANGAAVGALTADGEGSGKTGRALMINNPAVQTDSWKCQMVIVWKDAILEDEEWTFKMDYKSDVDCNFGNQAQAGLGSYQYNNIVPAVDSKTTWQTLRHKIVYNKEKPGITAIAFDLGSTATNFYFDNVSLTRATIGGGPGGKWEEVVTITPKSPEKKTEIVVGELERWLGGMMNAAGENIKDWVVINEPMDNNNPTQVRTAPASPGANDFYWQDYLRGKDYARTAVGFTRLYGGNGLRLFVNETGLNNKAKCEGLINMIKYWEQDGTTKIDGIAAQLNLTCSLDATTQKSNEDQVVEMFNLLKETGKLIRISAIDMRVAPSGGSPLPAAEITPEHQKAMSKYYNFVIRKYFEIIPAAQRYGITIQPFESSSNAGLWDGNNSRKFTYSGFADGLSGQNVKHD